LYRFVLKQISVWSNISSLPRADTSVRRYVAHAVAWGWEPEWHFIMHAAVIHLRLSVTPSAAVAQVVLQHNFFALNYHLPLHHLFCARISTFLHPSSRLQYFKSPTSTLHFHAWTKSFNLDDEGRMFLSNVSIHKT
jgi:hypothetical protein